LGLTCLSDPRYLGHDELRSSGVLVLTCLPDSHSLIPMNVSRKDGHSLGHVQRRMVIYLGVLRKDGYSFGLDGLPSPSALGLECLLDPYYLILLGELKEDVHSFKRAKRG
jgi:hypothetical protein